MRELLNGGEEIFVFVRAQNLHQLVAREYQLAHHLHQVFEHFQIDADRLVFADGFRLAGRFCRGGRCSSWFGRLHRCGRRWGISRFSLLLGSNQRVKFIIAFKEAGEFHRRRRCCSRRCCGRCAVNYAGIGQLVQRVDHR